MKPDDFFCVIFALQNDLSCKNSLPSYIAEISLLEEFKNQLVIMKYQLLNTLLLTNYVYHICNIIFCACILKSE